MDAHRLCTGAGHILYMAICRYSGLWQLAVDWFDISGMPPSHVDDEQEKEKKPKRQ
jgi:hypothetical protein